MRHIPNLLCWLRMALAPWCAIAVAGGRREEAFVLIFAASLTDYFDGYLARRWNCASPFGALLDPAADKLFLSLVYIALGFADKAPWWLVGLIFGRDLLILCGAALLRLRVRQSKFPPTPAGKISTAIQMAGALAMLTWDSGIAVGAVATGTAISGLDYVRVGWHMIKDQEASR
ncbi:MAG: CDP-alcohol phosphatidyltransferase family protein [Candidatus Solibacter usitatus]|nr:CDP-alcohol phosphatidyltransferase family protein [Candidatus Solibacter usitatus]